jgi:hypothetical protein
MRNTGGVDLPVKHFVPDSMLYGNRGYDLRNFSRTEMSAILQLKQKSTGDGSRKKMFALCPAFILAARFGYSLKKKQTTPILTSRVPHAPGDPPIDGDRAAYQHWQRKADTYAEWLLVMYRPETNYYDASREGHTNPHGYTYENLRLWIRSMREDSNMFSKFRLESLERLSGGYEASVKPNEC